MNCPSCQQPPMKFSRWMIMLDPMRVQCMNCATRLIATPTWRKRYYMISAAAMVIIVAPSLLVYFGVLSFVYLMQIFFVAVGLTAVFLISISALFWKRFEYQQDPEQQ